MVYLRMSMMKLSNCECDDVIEIDTLFENPLHSCRGTVRARTTMWILNASILMSHELYRDSYGAGSTLSSGVAIFIALCPSVSILVHYSVTCCCLGISIIQLL